ncbi:DUF975 family protein [Leuconostoc citreum]
MNSIEPISIRNVKREARALYHGRLGTAIKINIVPIVLTILTTVSTLLSLYIVFRQFATISDVSVSSDGRISQMYETIQDILSQAVQLVLTWSVCWTLIDWYEQPKTKPTLKTAFQAFTHGNIWHTLLLAIVQSVLMFLWTLLLIVPGVVKYFAYSQTYFIYKIDIEHGTRQRQLTDYITISRRLMAGRKWELFLLELSFIGWHILGFVTAGLAYIYVIPYLNATRVAYSRHLLTLKLAERQAT